MGFRFIGQPFPEGEQIGTIIAGALGDAAYDRAWIATAWGKQSGLSRIAKDVELFRKRGGYIEGIVGVDEGGATTEGLRLAIKLFDAALVFHDPGQRTFHPKIFVVQNADQAVAIVGSGNLTRGGLYTNYEGSVVADLDLTDPDNGAFLDGVRAYYERLAGLTEVCKPLTEEAIENLKDDPSIVVESERKANKKRQSRRGKGKSKMFGEGGVPDLLGAPPPSTDPLPADEEDDDDLLTELTAPEPPEDEAADETPGLPDLIWWKQMTASDAHRKPPTSHQRNYVALSQAGHNIDWTTWFREELFGDLPWSQEPMRTGNLKDVTIVPFEVYIEDRHRGQHNLVVDHYEGRIAKQRNAPTYLNWTGMLSIIEVDDYTDWWLELSKMPEGTYRLRLLREKPVY